MTKSRTCALFLLFLAVSSLSVPLSAQTVTSFDGMSASQLGRPQLTVDPDGAVGTKQFMEYVNFYYQGYDKTSFAQVWSTPQVGTTPWTNAGLTNCYNISGNGVITFDRLASRWVFGAHSANSNNYYYCIAISNTDDLSSATFAWNAYAIPLNSFLGTNPQGNVYFPDWPRLGVWSDAYYLTIDLNDVNQSYKEVGVVVCALDRTNMLTGGTPRSPQCFSNPTTVTGSLYLGHSLIPAEVEGTNPPPAGRNEYLLSIQNPPNDGVTTTSTSLNLWSFHVDWTTPANSTFTQSLLTVPSYRPGCYLAKLPLNTACVPESTTATTGQHLDSVGDRLEPRFSYRNFGVYESFLMSHAVQVAATTKQTGIRWYELRGAGTPSLYQSRTVSPDQSLYRFVPSITQDTQGNAGVGYSVSSATTHPSISASWWNLTNQTAATELPLFAGTGDQENTPNWGSYTSMTVDPVDGCTFWYVNQYDPVNQTTGTAWNTRIANFKVPTCGTVTVSPASLTFAAQSTGTTSPAQIVTLNNSQSATLNISSIGFTGANAGDFGQTNTCGAALPAGKSCTISVTFSPTAAGTRTATLNVTDDASGGSPQTVSISGTGTIPSPIITLSTSNVNFTNQVVGTTSGASPLTVTNTGNAAANFTSIAVTGTNSSDFGQSSNCLPSLPAGQSCTINVTFTPSALGARSASVTLTDNAANSPQNITLSGTGVAPVTFSTASLSFGAVLVGASSTLPAVTLTNNQTVALTGITIVASPSVFTQTNTCSASIAAGAQCTITVTFTPTDGVPYNGTVTITDSASNSPQTITLTGTGRQPVAFNPQSLSFGNQTVGTTSGPKTISVQNNQKVTLTITSITITGTNAGDYGQTNTCGSSLLKGAKCTITVTFTPSAKGNRTATLTVTDSAVTSPQTAPLTGTGN